MMKHTARKDLIIARSTVVLSLLLATASAWSDEKPRKPFQGDVEAGMVLTEGNSSAKSLKTGAKGTYETGPWRHYGLFESFTAEQEDEGTAERYFTEAKSGYSFTKFNYVFAYANYTDDRFTEFDFQTSASAGYGRLIFDNQTYRWDAEIGPGHRVSKLREDGDYEQETIAHMATNFLWNISETSRFEQNVLVEAGDKNTVTRAKSALITKINSAFSMKLSYTITYNQELPDVIADEPPEEGEETNSQSHADTETAVSLLYAF